MQTITDWLVETYPDLMLRPSGGNILEGIRTIFLLIEKIYTGKTPHDPNCKNVRTDVFACYSLFFKICVVTFAIVPTYTQIGTGLTYALFGRDFIGQKIYHKFII